MKSRCLLIFIFVVVVLFNLTNVSSWTDDGSLNQNVDGCGTLSTENAVYTLTLDVSNAGTCFTIQANNITLNGDGYRIAFSQSQAGYGIDNSEYDNTIIKNCYINSSCLNNPIAIYLYNVENAVIQNNSIELSPAEGSTTGCGIYLNSSNSNTISNNNFSLQAFQGGYWIYLNSSNSNTISNNDFLNPSALDSNYGIYFSSSNLNTLSNNTLLSLGATISYGVYFHSSSNNNITSCSISASGSNHPDLYLRDTDNLKVTNTTYTDISYYDTTSDLWRYWFLDVYVNDTAGNSVNQANVSSWNKNNVKEFSELTNSSGYIQRQTLLEYNQSGVTQGYYSSAKFGKETFYNNYTINATKTGYLGNTTEVNLTSSKEVCLTIETIFPEASITYPANTSYSGDVTALNYTYIETNPDKCWYSTDGGTTNSTLVSCGTNFTGLTSNEGSNTWTVYINDTTGNENSTSVTFFKDTTYPLIDYGTGTSDDNANLSQSNVYVNVSFTETNLANITFTIYNDTGNVNSTTYTSAVYTINWTNFADNNYSYEVNITDIANNKNSTGRRYITLDITNPIVSFSCSPTSVYSGDLISCSCSATDAVDSNPTISYDENPSTSETGTYTTTCTATDDAGNSASSSIDYIVESSGGGSPPPPPPEEDEEENGEENITDEDIEEELEWNNQTWGGNGGGSSGGGGSSSLKSELEKPKVTIYVKLKQGETKTDEFTLTNIGTTRLDIDLNSTLDFVEVGGKLSLEPKESKDIKVNISAKEDQTPTVYFGHIYATSYKIEKEVLVFVEVISKGSLFNVSLETQKYVLPGEEIKADVFLERLQGLKKENVLLNYFIIDEKGKKVFSENDTKIIEDSLSFVKKVEIPEYANYGRYLFSVQLVHDDKVVSGGDLFNVGVEEIRRINWLLILLIILLVVLLIIYVKKRIKEKKRKRKKK